MQVRFLSPASADLADSTAYYERQRPGLGSEFIAEVERAIRRITDYPNSCAQISVGIRRCNVARFPFGVVYLIEDQSIVIVAVMHLMREPSIWQGRL